MKTSIIVQNLKCHGCVNTITSKLSVIDNITELTVDKDESTVSFNYQSDADLQAVKKKLIALGYPSIDDDNSVITKAKSVVSCATGRLK